MPEETFMHLPTFSSELLLYNSKYDIINISSNVTLTLNSQNNLTLTSKNDIFSG